MFKDQNMAKMKRYYILKLESYEGENSSLFVSADDANSMFVVLCVDDGAAEIVDWGYSSVSALLNVWSNVKFENENEFV